MRRAGPLDRRLAQTPFLIHPSPHSRPEEEDAESQQKQQPPVVGARRRSPYKWVNNLRPLLWRRMCAALAERLARGNNNDGGGASRVARMERTVYAGATTTTTTNKQWRFRLWTRVLHPPHPPTIHTPTPCNTALALDPALLFRVGEPALVNGWEDKAWAAFRAKMEWELHLTMRDLRRARRRHSDLYPDVVRGWGCLGLLPGVDLICLLLSAGRPTDAPHPPFHPSFLHSRT